MKPIVVSLVNNNSNNKYNHLPQSTHPPPLRAVLALYMYDVHVTCLAIDQFVIELESRARCFAAL